MESSFLVSNDWIYKHIKSGLAPTLDDITWLNVTNITSVFAKNKPPGHNIPIHAVDTDVRLLNESFFWAGSFQWIVWIAVNVSERIFTEPASQCAYYPSKIICDISNFQYYLGQIGWIVCTLGRRVYDESLNRIMNRFIQIELFERTDSRKEPIQTRQFHKRLSCVVSEHRQRL